MFCSLFNKATMKKTRVPDRVTSPIRKLCNRIALGTIPQYVKVIVEVDAKMGDCFDR